MVSRWIARKEPWPRVVEIDADEFWERVAHQRRREVAPVRRLACEDDPDLFFSGEQGDVKLAKSLCATCHVATRCLSTALEAGEEWGVWGGVDANERRAMLARRALAAQRRQARKKAS